MAGANDSPSSELLAAWLGLVLKVPVRRVKTPAGSGVVSVRLERDSGPIDLVRPDGSVATLSQPGQPDRRISLKRRGLAECLADELRRLDADDIYAETLTKGLRTLSSVRPTASEAAAAGDAPSTDASRRLAAKLGPQRLRRTRRWRWSSPRRRPTRARRQRSRRRRPASWPARRPPARRRSLSDARSGPARRPCTKAVEQSAAKRPGSSATPSA